jgi:hypothetical protein
MALIGAMHMTATKFSNGDIDAICAIARNIVGAIGNDERIATTPAASHRGLLTHMYDSSSNYLSYLGKMNISKIDVKLFALKEAVTALNTSLIGFRNFNANRKIPGEFLA